MKTPEEIKKGLIEAIETASWVFEDGDAHDLQDAVEQLHASCVDALALMRQLEGGINRYCGIARRLEQERDELFKITKQLERERDALLNVLRGDCGICANYKECIENGFATERNHPDCWEWYGVQEVK